MDKASGIGTLRGSGTCGATSDQERDKKLEKNKTKRKKKKEEEEEENMLG